MSHSFINTNIHKRTFFYSFSNIHTRSHDVHTLGAIWGSVYSQGYFGIVFNLGSDLQLYRWWGWRYLTHSLVSLKHTNIIYIYLWTSEMASQQRSTFFVRLRRFLCRDWCLHWREYKPKVICLSNI